MSNLYRKLQITNSAPSALKYNGLKKDRALAGKEYLWRHLTSISSGKVYFVAPHLVVKLQADNLVRWDVAPRGLNRKQKQTG